MDRPGSEDTTPEPYAPGVQAPSSETQAIVGTSPMTPMGIVEAYGNIARAARHGNRSARIFGIVMLFIIGAPIIFGLVAFIVSHI